MPVYEHSNIDFGKTQTHFSAIQAILRSKIIRISKIGAPAFFLPDKYGKMRFTTRRERRSMEENSRMKRKAAVMLLLMTLGAASVSGCGKTIQQAVVPYQAQAAQALPQHPMRRAQAAHRPTAQLLRNTLPRVM